MPVYCQPSRKPVGIRGTERTENIDLTDDATKQSRNPLQLLNVPASALMQVKHGLGQRQQLLELFPVNGSRSSGRISTLVA